VDVLHICFNLDSNCWREVKNNGKLNSVAEPDPHGSSTFLGKLDPDPHQAEAGSTLKSKFWSLHK
jgi:hypothetical protein